MGSSLDVTIAYGIDLGGSYSELNIEEDEDYNLRVGSWYNDEEDFTDQAIKTYLTNKNVADIKDYWPEESLTKYNGLSIVHYGVSDYMSEILCTHKIVDYTSTLSFDPSALAEMNTVGWDAAIGDFLTTLEIQMKPGFRKPRWYVLGNYG